MAETSNSPFSELAKKATMQPQEKLQPARKHSQQLFIGIPKEITFQENRVPLTPSSVQVLVASGHEVIIESNAGKAANFPDKEYNEAGAKIAYNKQEVYQAEVVLKIDPPTTEEIEWMRPDQILISAIQMSSLKEPYLKQLMKKRVNALAYEFIADSSGMLPIIRSMSEIAGNSAILIAAEYLNNVTGGGKGEMFGGIPGVPPTQVVIIGAGTVAEYAAKAALGLGASVKIFDNNLYRLRRVEQNLSTRIYTSTIQPANLKRALAIADVAIGALRSENGRSPCVVTEEMVSKMKPHSVIIDISIDQGGCFETSEITTHTNPVFRKHDVIHYCVPNIPSRVSRTASYALSNIFTPMLIELADTPSFKDYLYQQQGIRKGVYIYKGLLTNKHMAARFGVSSKDIDLLVAAHI